MWDPSPDAPAYIRFDDAALKRTGVRRSDAEAATGLRLRFYRVWQPGRETVMVAGSGALLMKVVIHYCGS